MLKKKKKKTVKSTKKTIVKTTKTTKLNINKTAKSTKKTVDNSSTINTNEDDDLAQKVNKLTHKELALLVRFAPIGHKCFTHPQYHHTMSRFESFGGMTPHISKEIGWKKPSKLPL